MTDQIFNSIIVMTTRQQKKYQPIVKGTKFLLHLTRPSLFFGLKTAWRNNVKIQVSDPTRTIIDLINNPTLGGGIRTTVDILKYYFDSEEKSVNLLINYRELHRP